MLTILTMRIMPPMPHTSHASQAIFHVYIILSGGSNGANLSDGNFPRRVRIHEVKQLVKPTHLEEGELYAAGRLARLR